MPCLRIDGDLLKRLRAVLLLLTATAASAYGMRTIRSSSAILVPSVSTIEFNGSPATVEYGGATYRLGLNFDEGRSGRRVVRGVSWEIEPGPWMRLRYTVRREGFLIFGGGEEERTRTADTTEVMVSGVEVWEGGELLSSIRPEGPFDSDTGEANLDLEVDRWDRLLVGLRLVFPRGLGTPRPEERYLEWRVNRNTIDLREARPRAPEREPGRWRIAALEVLPVGARPGEVATIEAVVENDGGEGLPAAVVDAVCGDSGGILGESMEIGALEPGEEVPVRFVFTMPEDTAEGFLSVRPAPEGRPVSAETDGMRFLAAPLLEPDLSILSARPSEGFRGDSFEVHVLLGNGGRAASMEAGLRGRFRPRPRGAGPGPPAEVPVILPGETVLLTLPVGVVTAESLTVELAIIRGGITLADTVMVFPIERRPLPAPAILSAGIMGSGLAGEPHRVEAVVSNAGDRPGRFGAVLTVERDGEVLIEERRSSIRLNPGETRTIRTGFFPLPTGLTTARISFVGGDDSAAVETVRDGEPRRIVHRAPAALLAPDGTEGGTIFGDLVWGRRGDEIVIRWDANRLDPVEIDGNPSVILGTSSWTSEGETRSPAFRITSGRRSIRGDFIARDGILEIEIPRPDDTEIRLRPVNSRDFSIGSPPPVLVVPLRRVENVEIVSFDAGPETIAISVRDRSILLEGGRAAISIDVDSREVISRTIEFGRGETGSAVIPLPPLSGGLHEVGVTLDNAPEGRVRRAEGEVYIEPSRFVIEASSPTAAWRGGRGGNLIRIRSIQGDAWDLFASNGSETVHLDLIPEGETAMVFLPPGEGMRARISAPWWRTLSEIPLYIVNDNPPASFHLWDLGGDTPAVGRRLAIRIVVAAGGETLPAGRAILLLDGIMTRWIPVPRLVPGGMVALAVPWIPVREGEEEITIVYENAVGAWIDSIPVVVLPSGDYPPTRMDWDWTRPVMRRPAVRDEAEMDAWQDLMEILAGAPTEALEIIGPPLTTIIETEGETVPAARSARREAALELAGAIRILPRVIASERLPVTTEPGDLAGFQAALEDLVEYGEEATVLDDDLFAEKARTLASALRRLLEGGEIPLDSN